MGAGCNLDSPQKTRRSGGSSADAMELVRDVVAGRAAALSAAITGPRTDAATASSLLRGVGAAQRAEHVLALQDARAAQPLSHMLLQVDNAEGGQDRMRVDLRGSSVGATIDVADASAADQLRSRMQELAHALESRGLDASSLRVRVAGENGMSPAAELARAVAGLGDPTSVRLNDLLTQAAASSARARSESQGQRPQPDPQRQRSRKGQQGETP